jgi:hypothetical protein
MTGPLRKPVRAADVKAFIKQVCVIPEGLHAGEPLTLAPFQIEFIEAIYDNPMARRGARS